MGLAMTDCTQLRTSGVNPGGARFPSLPDLPQVISAYCCSCFSAYVSAVHQASGVEGVQVLSVPREDAHVLSGSNASMALISICMDA